MSTSARCIDAAVHPFVEHVDGAYQGTHIDDRVAPRAVDDLRTYMPKPWAAMPLNGPDRYLFPAPTGEPPYGEWAAEPRRDGGMPASDPASVRAHLDSIGADHAILLPLTRGLLPDIDMGNVVCAATNDWLADRWLGEGNEDRRFLGSIRLNPRDPDAAVKELSRWTGDPRFVQVAVPLEAHQPYGQRAYHRLWDAIAEADLPVAVRSDGGAGVDFFPTANGFPHVFAEYAALYPLNYVYHLTSLIAEGVFERFPKLRFVFTDGGHDMLMPIMWRMDMDWPITRSITPWVNRLPSEYLEDHVRFTVSRLEGPSDPEIMERWFERADGGRLLLYASHYPHWTTTTPAQWGSPRRQPDDEVTRRVLADNARSFYRLGERVA